MIRSDPAECAMESRIAHEWDILGKSCLQAVFTFAIRSQKRHCVVTEANAAHGAHEA
jgi:hypothetical protein